MLFLFYITLATSVSKSNHSFANQVSKSRTPKSSVPQRKVFVARSLSNVNGSRRNKKNETQLLYKQPISLWPFFIFNDQMPQSGIWQNISNWIENRTLTFESSTPEVVTGHARVEVRVVVNGKKRLYKWDEGNKTITRARRAPNLILYSHGYPHGRPWRNAQ